MKKLEMIEESYIDSKLLKEYCKELKLDYYTVIRYLLSNRYLYRILRGVFYKPSIEERKLGILRVNHLEAISHALRIKGVKNWYFGLESALKMNNLTHEFFAMDYVINDTIFRPRPITILGNKVRFIKLKKSLTNFGVKGNGNLEYSDPEKTVLDMVYLSKYGGLDDGEINEKVSEIAKTCEKATLIKYSSHYNHSVESYAEAL
ncbi:hypothetical protein J4419_03630 [Candidatus Woesearchaeota archaeon]|nr:hypothetical protein [Candidatus Woesearchaeota archaeon]